MKNLFLFSISPVQSFIAQARKTQDLFAGSYILSHLCRVAIEKARREPYQAEIIFPDPSNKTLLNRFLAVVGENTKEYLASMGRAIENAVRFEFQHMADVILDKMGLPKPPEFDEQIKTYWQIFWLFEEFEEGRFADAYKRAEQTFGSLKNLRKFPPMHQRPARKCSITGEQNVLFYRPLKNHGFISDLAVPVPDEVPPKYLAEKEMLGAIAFVKRCAEKYFSGAKYEYDKEFPSTAEIALMDTLAKWQKELPPGKVNAAVIFDKKNNNSLSEELTEKEKKLIMDVYNFFEERGIDFSSYYALIRFDGDHMGRWLAGEFIDTDNRRFLKEFQKDLSKELGRFAQAARDETLIKPKGRTVYTGGDDFLGFVNINHLFEVMKELRRKFSEIDLSRYTGKKPSFSAGVVIAHWKTPLGEVLDWAGKMEREAKGIDDYKDAFALAVIKHSGEIHKFLYKWRCGNEWTVDLLNTLINKIRENEAINQHVPNDIVNRTGILYIREFSNTFIKNLNREVRRLFDDNIKNIEFNVDKLIKTEIKRLLRRSCLLGREPGEAQTDYETRKNEAVSSLCKTIETLYTNSVSLENFLATLNIADFLAREVKS
ncbi:MAG: type III-B CRISPR-associated protein Cas10/Cmr2 [Peptococcaceae bacterium]|nr:type III-B CRISPR-associated protein Cas10/Cmr2 [Peptococcaceae bacterium]